MATTYAGIPILMPDSTILERIEKTVPTVDLHDLDMVQWTGTGDWRTPRGGGFSLPVRFGHLWWPRGASQFAYSHLLVSEGQLDLIRSNIFPSSGSAYVSQPLVIDDGVRLVTTDLFCLPPRPLSGTTGNNLFLLTLVDERFFWWHQTSSISIVNATVDYLEDCTTWSALIEDIAFWLGISITYSAIPSVFWFPHAGLAGEYEYLPLLLDAVAYSLGLRFVRRLNGDCLLQTPAEASTAIATNAASAGVHIGGGRFAATDVTYPASVTMTHPVSDYQVSSPGEYHTTDVTATSLGLTAIRQRVSQAKMIHSSAPAWFTGEFGPSNVDKMTALARAWAARWYAWQAPYADEAYHGVALWTPEGGHDIEWRFLRDDFKTRIHPGGLDDYSVEAHHYIPPSPSPASLTVVFGRTISTAATNGTYLVEPHDAEPGFSFNGTSATLLAKELNGRGDIENGTYVHLLPGENATPRAVLSRTANASQLLSIYNTTTGTFSLRYWANHSFTSSVETAGIPWNATATTVQGALEALPPVGSGNVTVTGNGPYAITFNSTANIPLMDANQTLLFNQGEWWFNAGVVRNPLLVDTAFWDLGASNSTFSHSGSTLSNVTFTNTNGTAVPFPANGTTILIARCSSCASVPGLWQTVSPGNLAKMATFDSARISGQEVGVNRSLDYANGTPNYNGSLWAYRFLNSSWGYCQISRCIDADLTGSSYRRRGNSLTMETGGVSPSNTSSGRITGQNITWGTLQDDAATGRASFKGAFHFRWNIDSYSSANTAQPLWNWNTTSGADNANAALGPNFIPLVGNGTFSLGTTYPSLSIPGGTPCFLTNAGAANITINYNSLPTQNLTLAPGEGAVFIKNDGANSAKPNNWFLAGVGFKKNFQELALEAFGNVTNGQAIYQRNGNWTVTENSGLTANGSLPNGAIFWFDEAQQKLVSLDSVPSTIGTLLVWDGSKWAITDTPGSGSNAPLLYDAAAPNGLKWGSSLASGNFTWLDGDGVTTRFIEIEKGLIKDYG